MKLPYFKLTDAFKEARDSFSYGSGADKLASAAKLLGKTAANVGMLVTEAGVEVIKRAPESAGNVAQRHLKENSRLMSDEQKEKAHEMIKTGNEAREKRMNQQRLEEEKQRQKEL